MARSLLAILAAFALAACGSPSPPRPTPTQPRTSIAPPSASSPPLLITTRVNGIGVSYPATWRMDPDLLYVPQSNYPYFTVGDAPSSVGACATTIPSSGPDVCPTHLVQMPPGTTIVTVRPWTFHEVMGPPYGVVVTSAARGLCASWGGEVEMVWRVSMDGMHADACLRGPDLAAHEAQVKSLIASLTLPR